MSANFFDKYELPSRVSLVLSYYVGRNYETSDDVLADRKRLIAKLDDILSRPNPRMRISALELRRDLIAGHPVRASHVEIAIRKLGE